MNTKIKLLVLFLVSALCSAGFCVDDTATLHPFYEQNGDCYVLIGTGANTGVWAINNKEASGFPQKLYDPAPLEAYGISVAQKWVNNNIEKRVYTFAAQDSGLVSIRGQKRPRRMVAKPSLGIWTVVDSAGYLVRHDVPPFIVHRFHSWPNSSVTGLGNHGSSQLRSYFEGKCYPCNTVPVWVGKDSEGFDLYEYTIGEGYYHSMDHPVYSPYTYDASWTPADRRPPDLSTFLISVGNYRYGATNVGGIVHYVCKEDASEATRNIKLYTHKRGNPPSAPYEGAPSNVATVLARSTATMKQFGECTDGCIRAQPAFEIPGQAPPIVQTAYSAQVGRSYLYNRPDGVTSYTLTGNNSNDNIVGNGGYLTTKFLGLSSKSEVGNYVYLLGKDVINGWMEAVNCPESYKIANEDDLACVAVSDQWWQTGGIVYAYDKRKGVVFCFTRVEEEGLDRNGDGVMEANTVPDMIDVSFDGIKPDKIACDGFGSLYMLKTEYDPPTIDFDNSDFITARRQYVSGGYVTLEAVFEQKVYKTVYERAYDTGRIRKVGRGILIGKNVFTRSFLTVDGQLNSEITAWRMPARQVQASDDPNLVRTELAVINCPTPPKPNHLNAVTDCLGPLGQDDYGLYLIPNANTTELPNDKAYTFVVENSPVFDANNLNIGNSDSDIDGDGRIGRFPSTLEKSMTRYYWKIRRTHDKYKNPVDKYASENQIISFEGKDSFVFPTNLEGIFEVGVKVTYGYYDYGELPVGALASARDSVLKSGFTAAGETAARDEDIGYSWEKIIQKIVPPPIQLQGDGILMAGIGSTYKPDIGSGPDTPAGMPTEPTKFVMDGYSLCPFVVKDGSEYKTYYKSDGNQWALKVRESSYNIRRGVDRISHILSEVPPTPCDTATVTYVPNSFEWMDNEVVVEWSSVLKRDGSDIFGSERFLRTIGTFNLTLEQLRELMPVPSEPNCYEITVKATRAYRGKKYINPATAEYVDGRVYINTSNRIAMDTGPMAISMYAKANICVTDNQGPCKMVYDAINRKIIAGYAIKYPTTGANFLKATTGEALTNSESGDILLYVADNNPMADYTGPYVFSSGYKDAYFFNEGDINRKRLRLSFNTDISLGRKARFYYDTDSGLVPDVLPVGVSAVAYDLLPVPGNIGDDELRSVGFEPSKALCYSKYVMHVSSLRHFTKNESGLYDDFSERLGYIFKNPIADGRLDLKHFGLKWQERCHHETYNPLAVTNVNEFMIGNIVTIDNDRPNGFIKAVQDRHPDKEYYVPLNANVNHSGWYPSIRNHVNSGPKEWFTEPSNITTLGNWIGDIRRLSFSDLPSTEQVKTVVFNGDEKLLTDVPVRFEHEQFDNTTGVNIVGFKLKNLTEDTETKPVNVSTDPIQHVFRRPCVCYVELIIKDNQKNWPSYSDFAEYLKKRSQVPPRSHNFTLGSTSGETDTRIIRTYFEVLPSKLEYRVLERGINAD